MNLEDFQIEIIAIKNHKSYSYNTQRFVKITHIESGITVTKYGRSQIKARDEAMAEITRLIDLWKCEDIYL